MLFPSAGAVATAACRVTEAQAPAPSHTPPLQALRQVSRVCHLVVPDAPATQICASRPLQRTSFKAQPALDETQMPSLHTYG